MKAGALRLRRFSPGIPRFSAGQTRVLPPAFPFAVFLVLVLTLGCVTQLPRPGQTTIVEGTPSPSSAVPSPTVQAVVPVPTVVPASPTPAPTVTATPTAVPVPTRATVVPVPTPSATVAPTGPFLQVYAPEEGATVLGNNVAVYGQTATGAKVLVSGLPTEVDSEGGFRSSVSLSPGENIVVVEANSPEEGSSTVSRIVTSLALPFLLLITEPENEGIVFNAALTIAGRTGPNAIVSLNGRSVPVDRFGYFASTVQLDEGPNVIDVVATNDDGQTLSTVLAVIYRRLRE